MQGIPAIFDDGEREALFTNEVVATLQCWTRMLLEGTIKPEYINEVMASPFTRAAQRMLLNQFSAAMGFYLHSIRSAVELAEAIED